MPPTLQPFGTPSQYYSIPSMDLVSWECKRLFRICMQDSIPTTNTNSRKAKLK